MPGYFIEEDEPSADAQPCDVPPFTDLPKTDDAYRNP